MNLRFRSLPVILFCFVLFRVFSVAQPYINYLGNVNVPHGVSGDNTYFSSCWGWVSPDGREYALLGTCGGTSIIDLNREPFEEIQFIPGPYAGYCLREMKTWKNYAYITTEGGGGTQIVDLSGLPDTAILENNFIYVDSSFSPGNYTTYSHTVTVSNGYLYLNGCNLWKPHGGVVMFSLLNDPANPEYVGEITRTYFHDSYVRNDTMYASAIYNSGDLGGLYIMDITDKTFPFDIGRISYTGSGTHNSWVSIDGNYVFTADEIGSTAHNMKIWDISQLPVYTPVGSWQAEPSSIVHNVHGRGHYVYVAHYTAGMAVVDVHDPNAVSTADLFDSHPGPSGGYAGCWGVYPYFPSGKWIGSDMQTGLYVFTYDSLLPRTRPRLLSPQNNSNENGTFFQWTSAANQESDPHYYEVHITGTHLQQGEIDTVFRTNDTSLTLSGGMPGSFKWHVMVRDEYTEVSSIDTFYFSNVPAGVASSGTLPEKAQLKQNYPNPFNPTTKIEFEIAKENFVTLSIYDISGKLISTLINENMSPGRYTVTWNTEGLPGGNYFYQLTSGENKEVKKMLIIR